MVYFKVFPATSRTRLTSRRLLRTARMKYWDKPMRDRAGGRRFKHPHQPAVV